MIRQAHCPVAVIKDDASMTPHAASLPVLVGIDGSPASDAATMVAFDEASRRGVDLIALHAWNDFSGCDVTGPNWSAREQQAKVILAERLVGCAGALSRRKPKSQCCMRRSRNATGGGV